MADNIFCPSTVDTPAPVCDVIFEEDNLAVELSETNLTVELTAGAGGAVSFPNHFVVTLKAGEAITQGQVLRMSNIPGEVLVADSSDVANYDSVVGLASSDSSLASAVDVVSAGICECALWSWVPGPIYFDSSGGLTQTPPTAPNFLLIVAKAIDATIILVDVEEPILLD